MLRHELLSGFERQCSGNAALAYFNVMLSHRKEVADEALEGPESLMESEWELTKTKQTEEVLAPFERTIRDIQRAARYRHCDWQVELEDGFEALLPHLAHMKTFARLLSVIIPLTLERSSLRSPTPAGSSPYWNVR